jgi:hypothetical protein
MSSIGYSRKSGSCRRRYVEGAGNNLKSAIGGLPPSRMRWGHAVADEIRQRWMGAVTRKAGSLYLRVGVDDAGRPSC